MGRFEVVAQPDANERCRACVLWTLKHSEPTNHRFKYYKVWILNSEVRITHYGSYFKKKRKNKKV